MSSPHRIAAATAVAAFLAIPAAASAKPHAHDVMRFAPAKMTIVGSDLKPRQRPGKHHQPTATSTITRTATSQPTPPPHTARWHAGDNQAICMNGGDVGPWLQAHGDNVMRFIVDPDPATDRVAADDPFPAAAQPGSPACVHTAEREGYPVMLSIGMDSRWTPSQAAERVRQVIASYGQVWAVAVGNEPDHRGSGHNGPMTPGRYAADWAAAGPALAKADPGAIRVYAGALSEQWIQAAWSQSHTGAQAVGMNCYSYAQLESISAWAATQGVPFFCPESERKPSLAKIEANSPDMAMDADYYWPAIGAYAVRAESRKDER